MIRLKLSTIAIILLIFSCNSEKKNPVNQKDFTASYIAGKVVYNDLCITCHLDNGEGVTKVFPPLANSDFLKNNQTKSIKGLKYGMNEVIVVNGITYNTNMAALGLTNNEIADVMNYINNSWENNFGSFITPEEVLKIAP
ncbi:cytochrome c [Ichthyenterobacterium sp. W332]|uniref:Cytochrome c n=1 Tax=Microcosmobacter mediterraneus TaxID=3075607 RepID=A0ABU2YHH3_9FLAO|nr:cytochrome c [Ichthyenterobacterium sp. W332]MDT0557235.1 cytochrome c [Ichthyenterobacterium sp. W332]